MMQSNRGAAQYRAVSSHGLVADGCMERIKDNRPLNDVVAKGAAMGKAIRLINQLNGTLDMERGGAIAESLRGLYVYILARLTLANATNDAPIVAEVSKLVRDIKIGWDRIVTDER